MKKGLLVLLVAIIAVVSSCSKDAKINRRLDGEWKVVTIGGVAPEVSESYSFKFTKVDKLNGTGTFTYTFLTESFTEPLTYSVLDEKITIIIDSEIEIFTVATYEKDRMELIDTDGDIWVLDPK